mmetsp:Transcript_22676/g.47317  ORF Transcript_22676/g.47317 Transcript_22676/m.47317 type:complete len:96 (-) Transcript_22676:291-578(-)
MASDAEASQKAGRSFHDECGLFRLLGRTRICSAHDDNTIIRSLIMARSMNRNLKAASALCLLLTIISHVVHYDDEDSRVLLDSNGNGIPLLSLSQ